MDICLISEYFAFNQGCSHWGEQWSHDPSSSVSEPNKAQQFQFQTGILLFTGAPKLYGPEISQFLSCMLQFLDNLWRHFIFLTTEGK